MTLHPSQPRTQHHRITCGDHCFSAALMRNSPAEWRVSFWTSPSISRQRGPLPVTWQKCPARGSPSCSVITWSDWLDTRRGAPTADSTGPELDTTRAELKMTRVLPSRQGRADLSCLQVAGEGCWKKHVCPGGQTEIGQVNDGHVQHLLTTRVLSPQLQSHVSKSALCRQRVKVSAALRRTFR